LGHTPQSIKYRLGMELRSQTKVIGTSAQPRATSEGRKEDKVGMNRMNSQADDVNSTSVNSPSSAIGIARGGKAPSRILPVEGDQLRAFGPQPRSESTGGATTSPGGDPPRRRGQIRESGDVGGRGTPGREPELAAVESGKHLHHPDEGLPEFTVVHGYIQLQLRLKTNTTFLIAQNTNMVKQVSDSLMPQYHSDKDVCSKRKI